MADTILIPAPRLTEIAASLLQAGGFTENEAQVTAQSLVLSNIMGYDSHGVIRVPSYVRWKAAGYTTSGLNLDVLKDSPASLLADAKVGLGQVQMSRFLTRLLRKAPDFPCVTGSLRNCGHSGRIGEWTEKIAADGYAAFVAVNDNGLWQVVAPPGGREGRTSTNPFAFSLPLDDGEVFTIDMSTSATALGKMRLAHLAGDQVEPGLIQDHQGNPSTNPADVLTEPRGALLPMGGDQSHKGFALSMIVDMLVSGLSGGHTPPAPVEADKINNVCINNIMVTIWNPAFFAGRAHMVKEARKYMAFLRDTTPIDPDKPVRLPGDQSKAEKAKRLQNGIPLSYGACTLLAKSAAQQGLPVPDEFKGVTS